jgi:hypothetical protein
MHCGVAKRRESSDAKVSHDYDWVNVGIMVVATDFLEEQGLDTFDFQLHSALLYLEKRLNKILSIGQLAKFDGLSSSHLDLFPKSYRSMGWA